MDISDEFDNHKNSRERLILNLFNLFIQNKWTLKCLEDTAKLINSTPGVKITIPTTKYLLMKELLDINKIIVQYHLLCISCEKYTKSIVADRTKIHECMHCGGTLNKSEFFVSFDLKQQLVSVIDGNFEIIEQFCDSKKNNSNITDVYDAHHMKNIKKRVENIYSLTLNTDGVALINSNTSSLWPVLITCNFLPPQIRFKDENIFVAALYFGRQKPNMHELLRPLAEELNILSEGIFVRDRFFNLYIVNAALDLPAKSDVFKLVQFNSEYSCNFCLQKGESTGRGIRYAYKNQPSKLRTHESMIQNIVKVNVNPNFISQGIKGISPMIAFKNFDLAKSFTIDYMHAVLLGVLRKMLIFWTDSIYHKKPFYINPKRQLILDQRMLKIKIPSYINRRPRSIKFLKHFKASELRSLLLYYLPIVTKKLLPKKYIDHLKLLSTSIYTLLKPSIPDEELKDVEEKLKKFVCQYEEYYGTINMTMNVHMLIHLVQCVRNFGPLWAFSMFPFESFNGLLKSFAVAPTDILHQITTRYLCYKTIKMDNKLESVNRVVLQNEIKCSIELTHFNAIESAGLVCMEETEFKYYSSYRKNKTIYTSRLYSKAKHTENFFIETVNGEIGAVEMYVLCNGQFYAIVQKLNEIENIAQFKKFSFSQEFNVIKAEDIVERYIHIEVLKEQFLVKRPNKFERN